MANGLTLGVGIPTDKNRTTNPLRHPCPRDAPLFAPSPPPTPILSVLLHRFHTDPDGCIQKALLINKMLSTPNPYAHTDAYALMHTLRIHTVAHDNTPLASFLTFLSSRPNGIIIIKKKKPLHTHTHRVMINVNRITR